LIANADASVRAMYWFVNHAYVGRSMPGESFWQPRTGGNYDVRVVDDRGRSDERPLGVSLVE
jgi:penicillin-binding protein 1C